MNDWQWSVPTGGFTSFRNWLSALLVVVVALVAPVVANDETEEKDLPSLSMEERMRAVEAELEQLRAEVDEGNNPWNLTGIYKDGFKFKTQNGQFEIKLGGRIQVDVVFWETDKDIDAAFQTDELDDAVDFRRMRLFMAGTLYTTVIFKAEIEFLTSKLGTGNSETNSNGLTDVYVGMKDLPGHGTFIVGHFKEPLGLEEIHSDNYTTFMERGLTSALTPSRNVGAMYSASFFDQLLHASGGLFRETGAAGDSQGDREVSFTGRVASSPLFQKDEQSGRLHLLHLGVAASHRLLDGDTVRYRARPEINAAPRLIDTGAFSSDEANLIGLEAAAVAGPFSVQAEYIRAEVAAEAMDNPDFSAWYVYGSWFVTGESRPYDRAKAKFSRPRPDQNFERGGPGWGAVELTARVSAADLNSAGIAGGELTDYTAGLVWYLFPQLQLYVNYVHTHLKGVGSAQAAAVRVSFDF